MGQDSGWTPLRAPSGGGAPGIIGRRLAVPRNGKEEAFLRLALTHGLVAAGDAMVTVSLAGSIFFTTSLNGARPKLVLSLLLTMAPFAVVAPFLGPAIDRSRGGRRLMIVASAVGRAVVCLYMATVVHGLMLYPCALAILILSKAHSVAKSALVPATVDSPAEFVKANGRLAIVASVAGLVAAAPAALLWKAFDASWAIRLAAVAYACAAVMAVRIRPAPPAVMEPPDHVDEELRSRGVSLASSCMITLRACSGFLTFAVAFVFRRTHTAAWWYGVVGTGALVGGFLGNLVGPKLRSVLPEERIITVVLSVVAVTAAIAARLQDRAGLALLALVIGFGDGVAQLAFDAIVQRDGSEGVRARSFARFEASFQLAWVGAALIPVVLRVPTWVVGVAMGTAAAASAVGYVVGRHTTPRLAGGPPPVSTAAPGWPAPGVALAFEGGEPSSAHRSAVDAGGPDVWSAVRPARIGGAVDVPGAAGALPPAGSGWPADAPTPPLGTPAVPSAPPDPPPPPAADPPADGRGPRRNPRRTRG